MLMNKKHMKSATTKYSEINTPENLTQEIFGLTSTLEKPTRGKPVREGLFIICRALRNNFLQQSSSEINTQTYLDFVPTHSLKMRAKHSSISVQRNLYCVWLSLHLLWYNCLKNRACLLLLISRN
jgi:hypothetical protein